VIKWELPAFLFFCFSGQLAGQNLQNKHTDIRAENDYQVNLKAEQEIAELKKELLEIKTLLKKSLEEK